MILTKQSFNIKSLIFMFSTGGWGPGGYFVPLMIQVILISPLLYKFAQYSGRLMLGVSFIIGITFELYSYYFDMAYWIYRIAVFRYLFAIALGVYISMYKIKNKKTFLFCALFSLIYITSINYFGVNFPVYKSWQSQNTPSFFYPLALVILGLKILPSKSKTIVGKILEFIGRKSYYIYLFQTIYFAYFSQVTSKLNICYSILINILLCVIFGLGFYYIENRVANKICIIRD